MISLCHMLKKRKEKKTQVFSFFLYTSKDKINCSKSIMREVILQRILAILGILAIQNLSNLKCTVERYSDLTPRNFQSLFPRLSSAKML